MWLEMYDARKARWEKDYQHATEEMSLKKLKIDLGPWPIPTLDGYFISPDGFVYDQKGACLKRDYHSGGTQKGPMVEIGGTAYYIIDLMAFVFFNVQSGYTTRTASGGRFDIRHVVVKNGNLRNGKRAKLNELGGTIMDEILARAKDWADQKKAARERAAQVQREKAAERNKDKVAWKLEQRRQRRAQVLKKRAEMSAFERGEYLRSLLSKRRYANRLRRQKYADRQHAILEQVRFSTAITPYEKRICEIKCLYMDTLGRAATDDEVASLQKHYQILVRHYPELDQKFTDHEILRHIFSYGRNKAVELMFDALKIEQYRNLNYKYPTDGGLYFSCTHEIYLAEECEMTGSPADGPMERLRMKPTWDTDLLIAYRELRASHRAKMRRRREAKAAQENQVI